MVSFSVDMTQVTKLQARMVSVSRTFSAEMDALTEKKANDCLEYVKQNASGRPGPEVASGAYRAAMYLRRAGGLFRVGNDSPQTHRLEFGFHGTDSAGRRYRQPPFPHFRPAAMRTAQEFLKEARSLVRKKVRKS